MRVDYVSRPPADRSALTPAQQVNDLIWSLNANPLWVSGTIDTRLWLQPLTRQQRIFFLQYFEQNTCRPKGHAFRLGIYFENLLLAHLNNLQQLIDLKDHLQVNRDKRTLGEFDFLYRFDGDDRHTHLEICVKFFLGVPSGQGKYLWVGLNRNDTLTRKINRLESHQLRLGDQPAAQDTLHAHNIVLGPRYAVMKGRLFYPWRDYLADRLDPVACRDHLRGWWLPQRDLEPLFSDSRFLPVEKQSWLGNEPPRTAPLITASETIAICCERPQMLRRFERRVDRWVPIDWGVVTPNHYFANETGEQPRIGEPVRKRNAN